MICLSAIIQLNSQYISTEIQIIIDRKQPNCQNVYYESSKEGTVVYFIIFKHKLIVGWPLWLGFSHIIL